MEQFRQAGGGDKPVLGGLKVCSDQIGPDQRQFFDFYRTGVLPRLRG